ncbi:helix-turn-helix domain-containing protein [Yinghuangia soli]|uniref:Helix-turn-helix domain-containing protein n=1 Tax=Yinghuangia soli TaxID=2908204 RepID=A0AA41U2L2_9ACTN|nr:helix-turn-helix domain-containing protein [Yinghuangia soli]MCF2531898.1 helix-turn-helix domain-containing protein [Yinghuangia soli]
MGLTRHDVDLDGMSGGFPGAVSSVDLARWAARRFAEAVRIIDDAEERRRRAVWGLLCGEQHVAAAAMAEAMDAPLPASLRVLAVACDGGTDPGEVSGLLRQAAGPGAWVVPGTGDETSLVVLLPAREQDADDDGAARRLARELTRRHPRCRVGASPVVELARVGSAYAKARHALAAAHGAVGGYARFHAWLDPELLMVRQAGPWALGQLAALDAHRARRRGDPDAAELLDTLDVWLGDRRTAGARLGIHRNTLSGRLRMIEQLLGRDLRRVGDRAELSLALRIAALTRGGAPGASGTAPGMAAPGPDVPRPAGAAAPPGPSYAGPPGSAAAHLPWDLPALDGWAYAGLRPLAGGTAGPDAQTLRVWLAHDARLSGTAAALCLTVPGARKRLARIGGVLGLDLLHGRTAEADLWLALRVADRPRPDRPSARREACGTVLDTPEAG